jgi:hypothetical protein
MNKLSLRAFIVGILALAAGILGGTLVFAHPHDVIKLAGWALMAAAVAIIIAVFVAEPG